MCENLEEWEERAWNEFNWFGIRAMVGLVNTPMNLHGHKRWLFTVKHKG